MSVIKQFGNKNIFITGGSGFIGKCLIEKILRCIPEVGNIYFLLRFKKGKTPEERLRNIFDSEVFDDLRKSFPDFLRKIILIEGDLQKPKLGINEENRRLLIDNVNIIYHSAATIRFDEPLSTVIFTNVRSTRDLIELALEAKCLDAFIHVSSTYANTDKNIVEEKLYPSHGDWTEAIRIAEEGDRATIDCLTQKYIHPLPNTYIYAKSLAEHVVSDLCDGKLPAAIVRPSIVTNAVTEPKPGWTDNLNGPMGLFYSVATGIHRITYGDPKTVIDCVPVDAVANVLILIAAEVLKKSNIQGIRVFNNSMDAKYRLNFKKMQSMGKEVWESIPPNDIIWYPDQQFTTSRLQYQLLALLYQILPAILIDGLLLIFGKEKRLFQIQKKIYIANTVLSTFMLKSWNFKNDKIMELEKTLTDEEISIFGYLEKMQFPYKHFTEYTRECSRGIIKYIFKQRFDVKKNRKKMKRFWILSVATNLLFYLILIWFILKKDIFGVLYSCLEKYVTNL